MLLAAVVIYVIALLLSAEAAWIQSRANPTTRFPVWRDVEGFRRPFTSLLTYTAAILVGAVASFIALPELGPIVILSLSILPLPPLFVGVLHNRSLRQSG